MSTEALNEAVLKLGLTKKGRFQLMRTWSFHGKPAQDNSLLKNLSTGSLDGDTSDSSSRKAQLCDSSLDNTGSDPLDRKSYKVSLLCS
ncbi:hypothetical protein ElyMa_002404600 [Elysia marginata]|uniref:Uncharacterized protein n=1 Tax=Elysia marginata TaxID=1093978 RepID=A0AAV4GHP1_9GAST|nr:hypothetical protein ElyMa_002404600 [Elysia marginata]